MSRDQAGVHWRQSGDHGPQPQSGPHGHSHSAIPPATAESTSSSSLQANWGADEHPLVSRFSLHHLTCLRAELVEELDMVRQAGIRGFGLNWRKLNDAGLLTAIRRVKASGLKISSLGWAGGFTGTNDCPFDEALHHASRIIRVAGELQAANVMIVTGPAGNHIRTHRQRLVVRALQHLAPLATVYGVNLCLQPMHRSLAAGWTFLHSLDETLNILQLVNHPRVKLGFGAWHLRDEPRLLDRVPEIVRMTSLVSLADWDAKSRGTHDRLFPGDGDLPLTELVDAFESGHYRGWYEAEVWSRDLWKLGTRDLMRRCVQSRDQIASRLPVR